MTQSPVGLALGSLWLPLVASGIFKAPRAPEEKSPVIGHGHGNKRVLPVPSLSFCMSEGSQSGLSRCDEIIKAFKRERLIC